MSTVRETCPNRLASLISTLRLNVYLLKKSNTIRLPSQMTSKMATQLRKATAIAFSTHLNLNNSSLKDQT